MNRISAAIAKQEANIATRLTDGRTTKAALKKLHRSLDMDISEFCKFQEMKSLAVASEKLTAEEGQSVYALLGSTPSTFNKRPVAVKAVLTGLFHELLLLCRQQS